MWVRAESSPIVSSSILTSSLLEVVGSLSMTLKATLFHHLSSQFMHPWGAGGHVTGWIMGHRSSNVERSRWVVGLLDIEPDARVLEVGCGPGVAVEAAAACATDGYVCGVDMSPVMVKQATRRNAQAVAAGRVD